MATISVSVSITKTQATLDAASIDAVLTWIDTNITKKLPGDTTAVIHLGITP